MIKLLYFLIDNSVFFDCSKVRLLIKPHTSYVIIPYYTITAEKVKRNGIVRNDFFENVFLFL